MRPNVQTSASDYAGPFNPEFSHEKYNKETLVRLLKTYGEYIFRITLVQNRL